MACQTSARTASKAAPPAAGVTRLASKGAYGKRRPPPFWRGYAGPIKGALKRWRSAQDDETVIKARIYVARRLANRALKNEPGAAPAGLAQPLAEERARLLLKPPKSLTVAERVERIAAIDSALAMLRRQGAIGEGQYRAALLDIPCALQARPARSAAAVSWLPERPLGAEVETASQVDPARTIRCRYRLVDLGEPLASNTASGAVNPAYDQTLQPRRRERAASAMQITALAQALAPAALLNPGAQWDDGPPIVNQAGMVESGNGRLLALRQAALTNPEAYAAYRQALADRAVSFGFDRPEAEAMKQPVLVRERLTRLSKAEQLTFVAEANSSGAARMGAAEQARADAGLIPAGFFADLQVAEADRSLAEVLTKQANGGVVRRFLQLLPKTEQAALLDSKGVLSAAGVQRLERAMFAYALPGEAGERLARLIYEESEAIDRVGAGLKSALPLLGQLEDRIRAGHLDPQLRLGEDLAGAAQKLRDLRRQGLSVNDYLRQHKILPELTAFQEQLLVQLDARRRSGRAVAGLLGAYASATLKTPSPRQGQLLDGAYAITPTGLFRQALKVVGGEWVELGNWSAAQQAISGFDLPAVEIAALDPGQQRLGMLVAASEGG